MREVVDVETAGGDICGHEEGDDTVAEFLHHDVALLLAEIAVECVGVVAVGNEVVGDFLCVAACAAEYDGVDVGAVVGDTLQGEVFVAGVHHVVYMADVLGALVAGAYHDFLGVFHEALGNAGNLRRHCGREHEHLAVVGHMGKNVVDRVDKAHVEHFVGFVEHYGVHVPEIYDTAVDEVDEPAWGRHDYLHAFAQGADLALDARTAVDGQDFEFGNVFGEIGEIAGYLEAELAGGCEHECLRLGAVEIDTLYQR